jgi:hypothetical protein
MSLFTSLLPEDDAKHGGMATLESLGLTFHRMAVSKDILLFGQLYQRTVSADLELVAWICSL